MHTGRWGGRAVAGGVAGMHPEYWEAVSGYVGVSSVDALGSGDWSVIQCGVCTMEWGVNSGRSGAPSMDQVGRIQYSVCTAGSSELPDPTVRALKCRQWVYWGTSEAFGEIFRG